MHGCYKRTLLSVRCNWLKYKISVHSRNDTHCFPQVCWKCKKQNWTAIRSNSFRSTACAKAVVFEVWTAIEVVVESEAVVELLRTKKHSHHDVFSVEFEDLSNSPPIFARRRSILYWKQRWARLQKCHQHPQRGLPRVFFFLFSAWTLGT